MIKTENHPDVVSALIGTGEFDMDSEAEAIRRVITSPGLLTAYTNPMNRRYSLDQSRWEVVRQAARTMLEHAPVGMILSMPDDDDENWRTLIDTAATEYAGELGKDMLGLIAQSEGNTQARTILAGRGFPKAAASNEERTWRHLPERTEPTGSTCGCLDASRTTSTISSAHHMRRNTYGPAAWTRRSRSSARSTEQSGRKTVPNGSPRSGSTRPNGR